ncbi:hypothetical protein, partial [Brevundimonas sp.]|uniref:hypothetical protein n=1 Tax=Brevundimonas sp. TaxID=1871086 RepID=UPI00289D0DCD
DHRHQLLRPKGKPVWTSRPAIQGIDERVDFETWSRRRLKGGGGFRAIKSQRIFPIQETTP